MVSYKLYYFNLRGRGEVIRFLFAAANQPFDDVRIEFKDWPAFKSQTMFGHLPVLEINHNGKLIRIAQSMTIVRHLARMFGLAGKNEMQTVYADMYAEQVLDLFLEFVKIAFEKDAAKKQELETKLQTETLPTAYKQFEARLASNGGHFAGCGITYADVSEKITNKNVSCIQILHY